jgi:hypothetical protein
MDFRTPPPTDRVYVSWSEHIDLHEYVSGYLSSRRFAPGERARIAVLECMAAYPGQAPYRKSDMDFYLDRNLEQRVGPLPAIARRRQS